MSYCGSGSASKIKPAIASPRAVNNPKTKYHSPNSLNVGAASANAAAIANRGITQPKHLLDRYLNLKENDNGCMSSNKVRAPSKKSGFGGVFGLILELCIGGGALIWVAYAYLPHQYYLLISFSAVVLIGVAAYFILDTRLQI